jgi:hypothetical protein
MVKSAVRGLDTLTQFADRQALPSMTWTLADAPEGASVRGEVSPAARQFTLWTADSKDRDFRDEKWSRQPVAGTDDGKGAVAQVPRPAVGFRAFLLEATLVSSTGQEYRLSTEARVTPDSVR